MCTAMHLTTKDHYFGRTLDLDVSYGEQVCVMPRRFPLAFRRMGEMHEHLAMIGMAIVVGGEPLFYDAANERGLAMAGLNFPGNAWYAPETEGRDNVTPFEFIPWILGQCGTVKEARELLARINLWDEPFSAAFPLSPLHWILADRDEAIVIESMRDGLHIHENPEGVMTNNPPFPFQMVNLSNYRGLSAATSEKKFSVALDMTVYCQGMGALGLPGDVSSMSRFVRTAFYRENCVCEPDELSSVGQFFHVLGAVEMPRGGCLTDSGHWDITVYTSCMNTDRGLYYYTTYDNHQISCVDMYKTDLDGAALATYPLVKGQQVYWQN